MSTWGWIVVTWVVFVVAVAEFLIAVHKAKRRGGSVFTVLRESAGVLGLAIIAWNVVARFSRGGR